MAREATGGAFRDNKSGHFFARIPLGRGKRLAALCPTSRTLANARRRAWVATALVVRLQKLGDAAMAEHLGDVVEACTAGEVARIAAARRFVGHLTRARRDLPVSIPRADWPAEGGVYYVVCAGRVKIGFARNIAKRLRDQTFAPDDLHLIAWEPGPPTVERRRHKQFAALRMKGEWFKLTTGILDHAVACRRAVEEQKNV